MPERLCHRCGHAIGPLDRVGRRDACLHCDADLHCCLNCAFFHPGAHNQCREPQAPRQVRKEVGNFCEYFSFRVGPPLAAEGGKAASARDQLAKLFPKK